MFEDGKEGFIVPIRDPLAITVRLEQMADDPDLRRKMSDAAIERVKFLGGWNRYGEEYANLCHEIAEERAKILESK